MTKAKSNIKEELAERCSPLPWFVSERAFGGAHVDGDEKLVVRSQTGIVAMACTSNVGHINAIENAAFIAECANNYESLLSAANAVLSAWEHSKDAPSARSAMAEMRVAVQRLYDAILPKTEYKETPADEPEENDSDQ